MRSARYQRKRSLGDPRLMKTTVGRDGHGAPRVGPPQHGDDQADEVEHGLLIPALRPHFMMPPAPGMSKLTDQQRDILTLHSRKRFRGVNSLPRLPRVAQKLYPLPHAGLQHYPLRGFSQRFVMMIDCGGSDVSGHF
eukprot:281812-Hanusia_phi.AAC.1